MSDIQSLATGLLTGINGYLGQQLKTQGAMAEQGQQANLQLRNQNALQTQKSEEASDLATQKINLDLNHDQALKLYEQTIAGKIDPETAKSLAPKAAEWVEGFNASNGRMPTVDEFHKGFQDGMGNSKSENNREQRLNSIILNYSEALEKNPIHRKMVEQNISLNQLNELAQLTKNGNTVASSAMGTKMARAMGEVGVLTESDITRYVQSGQLSRGASDKLNKWIEGKPTEATIAEIQQIGEVLNDTATKRIQPIYDRYINRLSNNMGISKEEAAERLDVPYSGQVKGKSLNESTQQPQSTGGWTYVGPVK